MNILLTLIVLAAIGAFAFRLYRSHIQSKQKAEEVKNSQINPSERVPGLDYDTTEVDPTKR
jgi:hypothetical protein